MAASRVTSKGQVTIPKTVRDALRIGAGDRVLFVLRHDGVIELRPQTVDLKDLFGASPYTGRPITIEEMGQGVSDRGK